MAVSPTIDEAVARIAPLDQTAMTAARERQKQLTKPLGALGSLEAIAIWLAGITRNPLPDIRDRVIIVAAADHGIARRDVTAYPQEVTAQMVMNFLRGGAAINVLARHVGARVVVVDAGVAADIPPQPGLVSLRLAPGTADMSQGPAMSRDVAVAAIEAGVRIAEEQASAGADIIGLGDMGIGNTTASSAITAAMTGLPVESVTGRGTGITSGQYEHKIALITRALAVNRPDRNDPIDVLAKVGGLEIGVLAGVALGGAAARRPVIVDGFVTGAAVLIACALCQRLSSYLIPSHRSAEIGYQAVIDCLGIPPFLELGMRLGEGTGAALMMSIVEAALRCHREMATFQEAGVSSATPESAPVREDILP